ncbi:ParB/Srx family N-terminal domain-containing protein [Roseofilum capinflatum]|uniref:ParB/Srx family N-terminal domain-containing protein n=1 Tax=Roseofilum capinflatum BLCC-M114 TaxID=3022440 RepID=A0ABT7B6T4_9CYAN|nr:ParB/Srx family N-terminal domain-containing protein [Roseofilum capinflatum]MDJ1174884.1 ParB/Srx family N-terminal domain-containing protein [Roseofilum capinflatum BLCC-M114]
MIVNLGIDEISPYEGNPRKHSEAQIQALASLMGRFGFHDSHAIAVDESGVVIWGHGRLLAAKRLGLKEVPVEVIPGLLEEEKQALRIADNAVADESKWDLEKLQEELFTLSTTDIDIDLLRVPDDLIDRLMQDLPATAKKDFKAKEPFFIADERSEDERSEDERSDSDEDERDDSDRTYCKEIILRCESIEDVYWLSNVIGQKINEKTTILYIPKRSQSIANARH